MKILMVTPEIDGIIKTGGLADFSAALPKALVGMGYDVRVMLPKYKNAIFPSSAMATSDIAKDTLSFIKSESLYFNQNHSNHYGCLIHYLNLYSNSPISIPSDGNTQIFKTSQQHKPLTIPIRLLEYHDFFSRNGVYDDGIYPYQDNALRYAFLCKASIEQCLHEEWIPDIIHCNDWQTALLPYYLKEHYSYHSYYRPEFKNTKTLLTIHNGEYQGKTDKKWLDALGILPERFTSHLMEEYGLLNLLKCGIMYADAINAVSNGYCEELLKSETSHQNLWLYLNQKRDKFTGILNGCDYKVWNPTTDPFIPYHFSSNDMRGKALCKIALQKRMRLPTIVKFSDDNIRRSEMIKFPDKKDVPLFGLISRLTAQKGFDYLIPALERLFYENAPFQVVMLGSGDPYYGSRIHHLERRYPDKMSFVNGYDNGLAHLIEAGSDFFMMPSLFEPCGLNQLYSLAYGTIPIVRQTGGLKDTVIPLTSERMRFYKTDKNNKIAVKTNRKNNKINIEPNKATGITFLYPNTQNCYDALKQAISLYFDYKPLYLEMQKQAMAQIFTWDKSAKEYDNIYKSILRNENLISP